jgi:prepilin peptidase CpaA
MSVLTELAANATSWLLLPFLAMALVTDIRRREIPNLLIIYMLGFGVFVQGALFGASGLLAAFGGLVVGLILLLPFYALGGMGAGDVKLLAGVGTFLGPDGALLAGALTLGAGGLLAVGVLVWHGFARLVSSHWTAARGATVPAAAVSGVQLPYSVAITAGTLIAAYTAKSQPVVPWVSSW